jgi:hypothetical protein
VDYLALRFTQIEEAVAHDFPFAAVREDRIAQGERAAVVHVAHTQPQAGKRRGAPIAAGRVTLQADACRGVSLGSRIRPFPNVPFSPRSSP